MKNITRALVFSLFMYLCFGFSPIVQAEQIPTVKVQLDSSMTIQEAANINNTTIKQVAKAFGVAETIDPNTNLSVLLKGQELSTLENDLRKALIEQQLENNKNWSVIVIKLVLWLMIIIGSAFLLRKRLASNKLKLLFSASVVLVLGFVLGSDPNPLGMIKDAAYIYGSTGVIFKPRIIVAVALLLTVLFGGRLFCGWGCHLGALQELFYALPTRKVKLPFVLTNSIRVVAFVAILVAGIGFALDLFGPIDPYQIFNLNTSLAILVTGASIILLGIFIYRPWCSLLCPFGLLAWFVDKFSFLRISYQPDLCQHCNLCVSNCPTGRVAATRKGNSNGECYTCGRCIQACPQKALTYGRK